MEKEKVKVEKAKGSPQDEDMVDLAEDAEEEKDTVAEREEEKTEKEKESSLDKWVRKVTVEKESLVEKVKDLCATIAERQDILLQSVFSNPGKGKGKGKSIRNVHGEYESWNQESEQWNEKWQNWNNNEGQQQQPQAPQASSSSSQPSVRMVSQVRGNESVRRVMQESTVTIEEVEDEVVDLIGVFNNFARSSNVRMVKEVKKRPKMNPGTSDEDSEEGMPKKYQRENILFYATRCARAQLQRRGYEDKEVKRRANVLRATWNQVKDQNDLVKEVLDFLNDYPDRAIRQEFLENLEFIYGEDDQDWKEIRDEDRGRREALRERKAAEYATEREAKKKAKASGSKDRARRVEVFDISEGDDEMTVIDELMEWYLGEDVERVRMINDQRYERDWCEPVEVCLDSGADCHVLPLSFYSEELGTTELPELRMMITDAQGNAIRTTETRANITFEDMELDPKCLSADATARMLHSVRSILAHRWSVAFFGFELRA